MFRNTLCSKSNQRFIKNNQGFHRFAYVVLRIFKLDGGE